VLSAKYTTALIIMHVSKAIQRRLQVHSSHIIDNNYSSSRKRSTNLMFSNANIKDLNRDEYHSRWEGMWNKGLNPGQGFDAAKASGAFKSALETRLVDVKDKKCFVPGCGRGYDVFELVQHGALSVTGLEIAPSAITAANDYLQQSGVDPYRGKVIEGDFFDSTVTTPEYDVGYDYTFFCALHPSMREDWAKAWARHIKPDGELVTLIFPVEAEPRDSGPPFCVHPDAYSAVLTANGFLNTYLEKIPDEKSHAGREGKEWFAKWKRLS